MDVPFCAGLHPKIETRKLGTLFIEWKGVGVSGKYRVFSLEFKADVAQRILNGESVTALHYELQIKRSVLYRWRDAYRKNGAAGLGRPVGRPPGIAAAPRPTAGPEAAAAQRIAALERKIGQQSLDLDFLRRACKRVKESRQKSTGTGVTASTERSEA
jgi:transposase-like protein